MDRGKAWFRECLLFAESHCGGFCLLFVVLLACILIEQDQLTEFAGGWKTSVAPLDELIMLTSPPYGLLPMPQVMLGPLAILITLSLMKHDHTYPYFTRCSTPHIWKRRVFISVLASLAMSMLYCVALGIVFFEKHGITDFALRKSTLFTSLTGIEMSHEPSPVETASVIWFDTFSTVLLEVALFLLAVLLLRSEIACFGIAITLSNLSLAFVRLPAIIGSGYFMFADYERVFYIAPLAVSTIILITVLAIGSCKCTERREYRNL